jgi:glycosyltransferase involved in cell wall biosynthesis
MRVLFYVDDGGAIGGPGAHVVRTWQALNARSPELVAPLVIPRSDPERSILVSQIGERPESRVRELSAGALVDPAADPVVVRPEFFAELCALTRREHCDHVHILWGFLHLAQLEAVPERDRLPLTVTLCDATARGEAADVDAMYFGSERWESYLREALRVPAGYLAISDKTRGDVLAKRVTMLASQRTTRPDDYVAYVGAFAEYKGVGHILDFALAYPEYRIKARGYPSRDFPIDWPRYPSVEHLGYLPYSEVTSLLSRARALLYLCYSEGFGLPMIEAQSLGVPLIVNPRNPMVRELLAPGSFVSAGNVASPTSIKAAIDVATRDRDALVCRDRQSCAFRRDEADQALHACGARPPRALRREGWGT